MYCPIPERDGNISDTGTQSFIKTISYSLALTNVLGFLSYIRGNFAYRNWGLPQFMSHCLNP